MKFKLVVHRIHIFPRTGAMISGEETKRTLRQIKEEKKIVTSGISSSGSESEANGTCLLVIFTVVIKMDL